MQRVNLESALAARERIGPYLFLPTPLVRSHLSPHPLFLKIETVHPTGSFKVRPALNGILSNLERVRAQGVLASSSGNFAQAVAWSASRLGCSAQIVMTSNTSGFKVARTRQLGAEVVLCEPTFKARWDATYRLEKETGRLLLHPYDSEETITGNATLSLELLAQTPALPHTEIDILVPVSGAGLIAGISMAVKLGSQGTPQRFRILGIQSRVNASLKKSLDAGSRVQVDPFTSVADALVALTPGQLSFEICSKFVDEVILVDEAEILKAVGILAREQKLVIEPGGAVGVAALLSGSYVPAPGAATICILSGGNIPIENIE